MHVENQFDRYAAGVRRKRFERNFIICFFIYLLLNTVFFRFTGRQGSYPAIINDGLMALCSILFSYFCGYFWLVVSTLSFISTLISGARNWNPDGNSFFYNIISIQISIWVASILISVLSERDMRVRVKNEWLSVKDELTGLFNQRYFNSRLQDEISKVQKGGCGAVSLCLIDIDNFKEYNDQNGHSNGDRALKTAADLLNCCKQGNDVACRYGGDEFAVIMPGVQENNVQSFIDRLQSASGSTNFTFSIGFSTYPTLANHKKALFEQADAALYKAKNSGRNTYKMYQNIFSEISSDINYQQLTSIIRVLLRAISEKDKYTYGHSERVAEYAVMIGQALRLPEEKIRRLEIEGLLHDIGKLQIPNEILNKREPLTPEEFRLIRQHANYSASIISSVAVMRPFEEDVKHHHERYDGTGYPDAIAGAHIPLGARILAVADSFDAMRSDRPYRKNNLSDEKAVKELIDNVGTQFDPQIVKAFLSKLQQEKDVQNLCQRVTQDSTPIASRY